jgi:hypothetical protein
MFDVLRLRRYARAYTYIWLMPMEGLTSPMASVYLLGAGFSRAVSSQMPMMNDLSAAIKYDLRGRNIPGAKTAISSNFEQWLSYLVEQPPWLSTAEQEDNRAAFYHISNSLHGILSQRQGEAVDSLGACPDWLRRLVVQWQKNLATVITFNYDNLVELAWRMHAAPRQPLTDPPDRLAARWWTDLYPTPIPAILRRFGPAYGGESLQPVEGMKLLKLHGSLTWRYAGPGAPPGDLIYETAGYNVFKWNAQALQAPDDWRQYFDDLDPMIVPPAVVKSPYYGNGILRKIWKLAANALVTADELVIMGFSLPLTDLLVSSMLATALPRSCKITPVNPDPGIVDRLVTALQVNRKRVVKGFAGQSDAIPAWVNANTAP